MRIRETAEPPADAIWHGECEQWWTGLARAHCPACHQTFSRDSTADRHRVTVRGVGRYCVHPASVGLVAREMPFGLLWSWPAPGAGADRGRLGWAA